MLFEVAVDVEETLFLSLASCGVIDDGYQSPYVRGLGLERGCCRTAQMTLYLPHPPFIRLCFRCLGTAVSKKREREAGTFDIGQPSVPGVQFTKCIANELLLIVLVVLGSPQTIDQ